MPRPSSFDGIPLREVQDDQRAGKKFEPRIQRGLERLGGWTARFTDTVNVDEHGNLRATAAVVPPDYIHCNVNFNLLVECKTFIVEKGRDAARVDFSRLEPHQRGDLIAFDEVSPKHHGFVAVLFYNREQGGARVYRCFLLPISEWVGLEMIGGRKSIPAEAFAGDLARFEARWVGGTKSYFDLSAPLDVVTRYA